jgi:hypothetical protein
MKLDFLINYRLDSPSNPNVRQATLQVPTTKLIENESKDDYLVYFCGEIANRCQFCRFYKNIQVMAPFLERPLRLKYMIVLPNNASILLEASLGDTETRKKAKELKDYFEIAKEYNKSDFKIEYPILLAKTVDSDTGSLEREYGIKIMALNDAVDFVLRMVADVKSH